MLPGGVGADLRRSIDALDVQLNVMQSRVVELETELALINTKTDMVGLLSFQ